MAEKYIELNLNDERAGKVAEILSNNTAKKILGLLAEEELSQGDIAKKLGLAFNTVDYNIKKLLEAGLIEKSKTFFWSVKGKKIPTYKLANKKIIISTKNSFKSLLGSAFIGAILLGVIKFGINYLSQNQILSRSDDLAYEIAPAVMSKAGEQGANLVTSASIWNNVLIWILAGLAIGALGFFIFKKLRKILMKGGLNKI